MQLNSNIEAHKWGTPSIVDSGTAIYRAGVWGVVLKLDEKNCVAQLYLGRIQQ